MKNIFRSAGTAIKRGALKTKVRISKNSPEILMVVGAVSLVGAVITAGTQTLKAEEILDEHAEKMDMIEAAKGLNTDKYSEEDSKRDKLVCYVQTGFKFVKLYSPTILLTALSIGCFFTAHGIMKSRNLALTAWGMGLDKAFKEYRGRVKKELGEEEDQRFFYGYEKVNKQITETDKDGNSITVNTDETIDTVPFDEDGQTVYLNKFIFANGTSEYWDFDELRNDMMLDVTQKNMNRDLSNNGFLFLNDVLKALGLKPVSYGQIVGWMVGEGDGYIDFRKKKLYRKADPFDRRTNPMGNEWEAYYELDFNTCGVIYDKI